MRLVNSSSYLLPEDIINIFRRKIILKSMVNIKLAVNIDVYKNKINPIRTKTLSRLYKNESKLFLIK